MGKTTYLRLRGSRHLRQRLVLATLTATPIAVKEIHSDESFPGLRPHEVSLFRLLEKVTDHSFVEFGESGTNFIYKPGVLIGGKNLVHDCGLTRSIGYFLEPLILLGLFGKKPLSIRLKGITNDSKDPSVDTFRTMTLHMLKHFGIPLEGLELKIESRGAPPLGGGEVLLRVPIIPNTLTVSENCVLIVISFTFSQKNFVYNIRCAKHAKQAAHWVDEGMIKRIRGITFSMKVSPQMENRMIFAARGVFNNFIPDVHIFTDHRSGPAGGRSPGYGMSLVAETTTGCLISADITAYEKADEMDEDTEEKPKVKTPEEVGVEVASTLLQEIKRGGVVDSTHQGLLFILCALCPPDVAKVRVGALTPYGIDTLRNIRDFLGVKFVIKPDTSTNTIILKCVGSGMKNLARKIS